MKNIKKQDFVNFYILPYIIPSDKPFNRQLWNDAGDMCIKNGELSEKRFNQWVKTPKKYFGENS